MVRDPAWLLAGWPADESSGGVCGVRRMLLEVVVVVVVAPGEGDESVNVELVHRRDQPRIPFKSSAHATHVFDRRVPEQFVVTALFRGQRLDLICLPSWSPHDRQAGRQTDGWCLQCGEMCGPCVSRDVKHPLNRADSQR